MRSRLFTVMLVIALTGSACAGDIPSEEGTGPDTTAAASGVPAEERQAPEGSSGETSTTSGDSNEPTNYDNAASDEQSEALDQAEPPESSTTTTRATKEPERVPDDFASPVTGETPADLLARIIADAADLAGVTDSEVTVIRDEFVIWNDGSLGCPQPGQMYTQALVDGYWLVLEANGVEYDYRANTKGYFLLCEGGGLAGQAPSG